MYSTQFGCNCYIGTIETMLKNHSIHFEKKTLSENKSRLNSPLHQFSIYKSKASKYSIQVSKEQSQTHKKASTDQQQPEVFHRVFHKERTYFLPFSHNNNTCCVNHRMFQYRSFYAFLLLLVHVPIV